MPKGPKGEKRPTDVIANAVKIMKIATGEIEEDIDTPEKEVKDPAAGSMGKLGGKARAEKMTPERRAEIAKKAAQSRWRSNKSSRSPIWGNGFFIPRSNASLEVEAFPIPDNLRDMRLHGGKADFLGIAGLKLDADWVILSACNTAAGGAEGAEALSSLARGFIYAQARALLVSHLEVASDARSPGRPSQWVAAFRGDDNVVYSAVSNCAAFAIAWARSSGACAPLTANLPPKMNTGTL